MKSIREFYPLLKKPSRTVITMHQKPDADAMGSSLALAHFLRGLGHSVQVISPTNWAKWLDWMPGATEVVDYEAERAQADSLLDAAEWLFCLDFNVFIRTRFMAEKLRQINCIKVLIDHHQEPDAASFDFGASDTGKSSTCEMVYDFIVGAGYGDAITTEIAECIYGGVVADTGSFRFSSTSANVHSLVADLKGRGLDHVKVHEHLFDNFLENKLRFTGHVLLNRLDFLYEYNTALIAIPKGDLLRFQIKTGDTEGLVNLPQSVQDIKLVGLVIDRDEERKWSFRSKGNFDCNTFARTYFNGGGHFHAAGGRSTEPLDEAVRKFKLALQENELKLQ